MLLDREGYLFSISGGWKKVLKRGPYKQRVLNLEVRVKTSWWDWKPEDLCYHKPKKIYFWQNIDWPRIQRYWIWRGNCVKKLLKRTFFIT